MAGIMGRKSNTEGQEQGDVVGTGDGVSASKGAHIPRPRYVPNVVR